MKALARATSAGVVHHHQNDAVEVAVARVADDRRDEPAPLDVALGLGDAFGKPRDRDADVGHDGLRARAGTTCRPRRRRAAPRHRRLRSSGSRRPLEGAAPELRAISPKRSDCSATPASVP